MLTQYKDRYSTLFRAISIALVCLFLLNDIAYAAPELFSKSSKATLAPPLATASKDFRTRFEGVVGKTSQANDSDSTKLRENMPEWQERAFRNYAQKVIQWGGHIVLGKDPEELIAKMKIRAAGRPLPIDPDSLLDWTRAQGLIKISHLPLKFGEGTIYHAMADLDSILRSGKTIGKILLTRIYRAPATYFHDGSKNPAVLVFNTKVFNRYLARGLADMKGGPLDFYPEITAPVPLEEISEIWVSEESYARYQSIAAGKLSNEEDERLRPLLVELIKQGKLKVIPGLWHLQIDKKGDDKSDEKFTEAFERYVGERDLLKEIPPFLVSRYPIQWLPGKVKSLCGRIFEYFAGSNVSQIPLEAPETANGAPSADKIAQIDAVIERLRGKTAGLTGDPDAQWETLCKFYKERRKTFTEKDGLPPEFINFIGYLDTLLVFRRVLIKAASQPQRANPAELAYSILNSEITAGIKLDDDIIIDFMDALLEFTDVRPLDSISAKGAWFNLEACWHWALALSVNGGTKAVNLLSEELQHYKNELFDSTKGKSSNNHWGVAYQEILLEAIFLARTYSEEDIAAKRRALESIKDSRSPPLRRLAGAMLEKPLSSRSRHSVRDHKILTLYATTRFADKLNDYTSAVSIDKLPLLPSTVVTRHATYTGIEFAEPDSTTVFNVVFTALKWLFRSSDVLVPFFREMLSSGNKELERSNAAMKEELDRIRRLREELTKTAPTGMDDKKPVAKKIMPASLIDLDSERSPKQPKPSVDIEYDDRARLFVEADGHFGDKLTVPQGAKLSDFDTPAGAMGYSFYQGPDGITWLLNHKGVRIEFDPSQDIRIFSRGHYGCLCLAYRARRADKVVLGHRHVNLMSDSIYEGESAFKSMMNYLTSDKELKDVEVFVGAAPKINIGDSKGLLGFPDDRTVEELKEAVEEAGFKWHEPWIKNSLNEGLDVIFSSSGMLARVHERSATFRGKLKFDDGLKYTYRNEPWAYEASPANTIAAGQKPSVDMEYGDYNLEYIKRMAGELKGALDASLSRKEAEDNIAAYLNTYSYRSLAIVESLNGLLSYGLPRTIAEFFSSRNIWDKTMQSNILESTRVLYSVSVPKTVSRSAIEALSAPHIVYGPGWNDDLTALKKLLSDPDELKKLLSALSEQRRSHTDDESSDTELSPLEYAKREGLIVRYNDFIKICPITESFRRHILIVRGGSGREYQLVVKMPGNIVPRRSNLDAANYSVAADMWDAHKEGGGILKPVAMISAFGEFPLYGNTIVFLPESHPMRAILYEYMDGKRLIRNHGYELNRAYLERVAKFSGITVKQLERYIAVNVLVIGKRILDSCYIGTDEKGRIDWHLRNFMLTPRGRVYFVDDFESFRKAKLNDAQKREALRHLVSLWTKRYGLEFDDLYPVIQAMTSSARPKPSVDMEIAVEAPTQRGEIAATGRARITGNWRLGIPAGVYRQGIKGGQCVIGWRGGLDDPQTGRMQVMPPGVFDELTSSMLEGKGPGQSRSIIFSLNHYFDNATIQKLSAGARVTVPQRMREQLEGLGIGVGTAFTVNRVHHRFGDYFEFIPVDTANSAPSLAKPPVDIEYEAAGTRSTSAAPSKQGIASADTSKSASEVSPEGITPAKTTKAKIRSRADNRVAWDMFIDYYSKHGVLRMGRVINGVIHGGGKRITHAASGEMGIYESLRYEELMILWNSESSDPPGTKFYDLGSGDGRVAMLYALKGYNSIGVEFAPSMFEQSVSIADDLFRQMSLVKGMPCFKAVAWPTATSQRAAWEEVGGPGRLEFICTDFKKNPKVVFEDAGVIYSFVTIPDLDCSILPKLHKMPVTARFISPFPPECSRSEKLAPGFEMIHEYTNPGVLMYVYKRVPAPALDAVSVPRGGLAKPSVDIEYEAAGTDTSTNSGTAPDTNPKTSLNTPDMPAAAAKPAAPAIATDVAKPDSARSNETKLAPDGFNGTVITDVSDPFNIKIGDIVELANRRFLITGVGRHGNTEKIAVKKAVEIMPDGSRGDILWLKMGTKRYKGHTPRESAILTELNKYSGESWTSHFAKGTTLCDARGNPVNVIEHIASQTLGDYIEATRGSMGAKEYFEKHFLELGTGLLEFARALKEFKMKTGYEHGDLSDWHIYLSPGTKKFVAMDYHTQVTFDTSRMCELLTYIAIREYPAFETSATIEKMSFMPDKLKAMLEQCVEQSSGRWQYHDMDSFIKDLTEALFDMRHEDQPVPLVTTAAPTQTVGTGSNSDLKTSPGRLSNDRSFIQGGIKRKPPWVNNPLYRDFATANMGSSDGLDGAIDSAVKLMNAYGLSVHSGGIGLSLGFGYIYSEVTSLKKSFGLSVVHGIDWNANRVISADKALRASRLSTEEFILHHADMNDLSKEIPDASIDFAMGIGITTGSYKKNELSVQFAKELLRVLKPGGIVYIHSDIRANPDFVHTLLKGGRIFGKHAVLFQKTGKPETVSKPIGTVGAAAPVMVTTKGTSPMTTPTQTIGTGPSTDLGTVPDTNPKTSPKPTESIESLLKEFMVKWEVIIADLCAASAEFNREKILDCCQRFFDTHIDFVKRSGHHEFFTDFVGNAFFSTIAIIQFAVSRKAANKDEVEERANIIKRNFSKMKELEAAGRLLEIAEARMKSSDYDASLVPGGPVVNSIDFDVQNAVALKNELSKFYEEDAEKTVYTIRLDTNRVPTDHIELIKKHYARILASDKVEVRVLGNDKIKGLVDVSVETNGRVQGNGTVDLKDGTDNIESLGRLIGMVNLAMSVATLPEEFIDSGVEKYRSILDAISNQYELLTGEKLMLPADPKDIASFIRALAQSLPSVRSYGVKAQNEFRLMEEKLRSAA